MNAILNWVGRLKYMEVIFRKFEMVWRIACFCQKTKYWLVLDNLMKTRWLRSYVKRYIFFKLYSRNRSHLHHGQLLFTIEYSNNLPEMPRTLKSLRYHGDDKIRSYVGVGPMLREPTGTFRDIRESPSQDFNGSSSVQLCSTSSSLVYRILDGDSFMLLQASLELHCKETWGSKRPFPIVTCHHHRMLRIPGEEYISSCLFPLRRRYSIAVKSFFPMATFFWNSDLSIPLDGELSSDPGSIDSRRGKGLLFFFFFSNVPSKSQEVPSIFLCSEE